MEGQSKGYWPQNDAPVEYESFPRHEWFGSLLFRRFRVRKPTGNFLCLEALAVHDARAGLVVLVLGDPHLLEGGQRGEDGAANPDRVLPLRGCDNLDLDRGWCEGGHLLVETRVDFVEHRGAARQD